MCNFLISLNWPELFAGALLGTVLGFLASVLWDQYKTWKNNNIERDKFSFLVDKYQSKYGNGNIKSEAEIFYIKHNLLKIIVKHDARTWEGTITMSTTEFGNLAFAYKDDPENVGMKLIVLHSERNSFTLIPEIYYMTSKAKEFDKEVYERLELNAEESYI
ncbi:Uncharacterised protein [Sphingobacterium daejeonense]|nr:Uncharacterised protein [Sphingobacterium daejeonense]